MSVAKNGYTILLGEDGLEERGYLETALRCEGYSTEVAQDGEEVLACLRASQTPISAVVLDAVLPRRSGMDTLKEIRRFTRDLPVIMISGASSAVNVADAMKSGANDFIAKPINPTRSRKPPHRQISRSSLAPPRKCGNYKACSTRLAGPKLLF